MNYILSPVLILSTLLLNCAHGFDHSHATLQQVLEEHVQDGLVDYEALKHAPGSLDLYLGATGAVTTPQFESWSQEEKLSFLINLYNAATLKLIIDHYPIASIKRIPDRWDLDFISLFGAQVSLNYVEHELIRGRFDEPRIHFALVCAALSCPPLRSEAYQPTKLDQQLEDQARIFLSEPSKNYVAEDGTLYLSQVFDWFTEDFVSDPAQLPGYVKPWLPESASGKVGPNTGVSFTHYDWSLNEKGAETPAEAVTGLQGKVLTGLQYIDNLGPIRVVIYVIGYVGLSLALVSGGLLTMAGGFLFGPLWGTVLVSAASTTAAALAFLIGRYLARGFVEKKIEQNENFLAVDKAVGHEGWKIVLLTRLSPLFPYVFLNYAYGLTKVRFSHYVLASWIGMLPGTIVYVWIGSLAKNLASLAAGGGEKSPAQWILTVVGFLAAVAVTAYVTKIARKALKERVE